MYTTESKDTDFTCTILSNWPADELMIVTHYPISGPMTNMPSSGVTTGEYDLAETNRTDLGGVFVGVAIDDPLPSVSW